MVTDTNKKIRRHFDVTSSKWYFSVADVLEATVHTRDSRNYWKVLKNRLKTNTKKEYGELVTKCNQLKMKAKDGKYYLTDVADSETMIGIIESIPKASVEAFKVLIEDVAEVAQSLSDNPILPESTPEPTDTAEAELLVDACETSTEIIIKTMTAGLEIQDINISVHPEKVFISGKREKQMTFDYFTQELLWLSFSRNITLPSKVDTSNFETSEQNGMLIIKLKKINVI